MVGSCCCGDVLRKEPDVKTEIRITIETDKPPVVSASIDGREMFRAVGCVSIEHAIMLAIRAIEKNKK
jgi:hypothetical protein